MRDLKNQISEGYGISVHDTTEKTTHNKVRQGKCDMVREDNYRLPKYGYILFTQDTNLENGKHKLFC